MENELIVVVPTFHKRVKYISHIEDALTLNFNPPVPRAYISDIDIKTIQSPVFVSEKKEWVEILLDGLEGLEKQFKYDYVFILLEDLFPFTKVPVSVIEDHLSLMKERDFKCITFSTYPREWMEESFTHYDVNGKNFYKIPQSFRFYSQLQPGIWNKAYLKSILTGLINDKKFSPWEFEYVVTPEIHLMSDYIWPNVLGGFIESGKVNKLAIDRMRENKDLNPLSRLLTKEYYLEIPGKIFKKIF
jgi:hypothetical protein